MANFWLEEVDGIVTIGLTEALQDEAGEISYASIAELGRLTEEDTLINLEASKAAIEVPSPMAGEIIEVHEEAQENPSLLNEMDKASNWIVKMKRL